MVRSSGDVIPVAEWVMASAEDQRRQVGGLQLQQPFNVVGGSPKFTRIKLYNRKNGDPVGGQISVGTASSPAVVNQSPPVLDVLVRDDRILVVTTTGRQPIGLGGDSQ